MNWAVKNINNVLIEGGIDFLGNEEKRFGATPGTKFAPARSRTTPVPNMTQPTGQACAAPLTRKCRKSAHTVAHRGRDRKEIGKPSNVVKNSAVRHGGKIVRDVKELIAPDHLPEKPVDTAPANSKTAFYAHVRSLFPGWKEDDKSGFALGDMEMVDRLADNLIKRFNDSDSAAPYAMAIAMAQRLADVTDGDIRHARQVLGFMMTPDEDDGSIFLETLFQPEHLEPKALVQMLRTPHAVRSGSENGNTRLSDAEQQALALQVAVSLSRHTHDFGALRKLLHPDTDFTPDDTRVYTKPAPHWHDPTDRDCADGLLQNALQALDLMRTARKEEDRTYAGHCLTMLCDLRARLPAEPAALDADHAFNQYRRDLTVTQRGELYAWKEGFRSMADIRAAGRRMRKNAIWMWRSEAIKKSRVLKWTPAPLRSLFWGKAPFQAMRMGDGGASMKHPPEMQTIYDDMISTLLKRLRHQFAGSIPEEKTRALTALRNGISVARGQNQTRAIHQAIDKLFWITADECFRDTNALPETLRRRFRDAGVQTADLMAYLRHLGCKPNADAPLTQLMAHCLDRRFLEREFRQLGLMAQGPLPQVAAPIDADAPPEPKDIDPRMASQIFEALRRIEKGDLSPRDLTIEGIREHTVRMVHQNQDNTWRAEEKLGSGANGVIFAGVTKFNSLGVRVTGTSAASAYFGIESKNWGMEITFGRRSHRNTGADVRYVAGSEEEFGEHCKASLSASLGYDSEHVDTEGIKILVRRDYDKKGGIKNAKDNGQPVLGEDGRKVQAHRHESQRVLKFFANAAQRQQFSRVGEPAGQAGQHQRNGEARLRAYDPLDVFNSFANEFFDSKLISVSQTHATSSTQKVSGYIGATARAALTRNGRKFQIGASAVLLQGSHTSTKNATYDQNGKQALNMVSYNHAVDLRSSIGTSGAVMPGFNPDTVLPTTANSVGLGATVTYRARETRGQLSLLKKNDLTDAVFCYSCENYKRPEEFRAAIERDRAAWEGYFGGADKLQAAIDDVVATAKKSNVVMMVRRRLREHVGPQLDALDAQIAFYRSIVDDKRRNEKQRANAAAHIYSLQNAMETLLSRADSFEPFGLGSFSRIEKTRNRGISYYAHFVNTQSVSATQELIYKARKPVERDTVRHLGELAERDQRKFGGFIEKVGHSLHLHEKQVAEARALVKAENREDPRGQAVEDARHQRKIALRRSKQTQRLHDGWKKLLQLRQGALRWRLDEIQRDGDATIKAHAARLDHAARSLEGLLRHIDKVEDMRTRKGGGGGGLITDISNPSYHLLRHIHEYAESLETDQNALLLAPAANPEQADERRREATARRTARGNLESTILNEIGELLVAVERNVRMRGSDQYHEVSESGWADLHQLAQHWERLHAATLLENAADAMQPAGRRLVDAADARKLIATAESRHQLDRKRVSYDRLVASDLSDDEALGPRPADGRHQLQDGMLRDHHVASHRAQLMMRRAENLFRYQPQAN